MLHSYLLYGLLVWGNSTSLLLKTTAKLQKRAIRYINKASYNSHTEPLFKQSNILKLEDQYRYEALLFMYNYYIHKIPHSFMGVFKQNYEIQNTQVTRQSNLLHIPRCSSNFAKSLPFFNFPLIWNSWSSDLIKLSSTSVVKKFVKSKIMLSYSEVILCRNKFILLYINK